MTRKLVLLTLALFCAAGIGLAQIQSPFSSNNLKPAKQNMPELVIPPAPAMKGSPKTWHLQEGFEAAFLPAGWDTIRVGGTYANFVSLVTAGTSPTCSPHAGANMVKYNSFAATAGNRVRLATPPVIISSGTDSLSFWMTHDPGYATYNDRIVVEIMSKPAGGSWDTWAAVDSFSRYQASLAWGYHALSLGAYNGDSVRVSLTGHSMYGNNMFLDDVAIGCTYVPLAHDAGVVSIDTPATAVVAPSAPLSPAFTIKNIGTSKEGPFSSSFNIYDSTGSLVWSYVAVFGDSIASDSSIQFVMSGTPFTPAQFMKYRAETYTSLSGDMWAENDTIKSNFRTWDLDVSADSILNPLGSANPDSNIVPQVTFHNAATQTADFIANFEAAYGGVTMYDQQVNISGLAGGADTTVEFPAWPGVRLEGTYQMTAYAVMAHDMNNANDTISGTFASGYSLWQTWTPLGTGTAAGAQAGYQDKLYMFGGYTGVPISQISIYDTVSASWSTSSVTLSAASDLNSAVAARGKIFVMGGENTSGVNANLDCYSPDGDSLNPRTAMPTAGLGIVTAVWRDSLIYRFGGLDASYTPTATVEVYDVASDSWITSPTPLPTALCHHGGTILGDTIVISTGYDGVTILATTYIGIIDPANPDSITWSAGPDYPGGAIYGSAGGYVSNAAGHKLLIAGGTPGSVLTGATYAYSTSEGWTQMPDKTTPFFYNGGSQVGEYFVVAGGFDGGTTFTCNEALYLGSSEAVQPMITATSPVDGGTDVDVVSPVVITFSKSMDTTAVTYSCIPDPGNLTAAWNFDYTIMTVSHDSFAYSTSYSFMVTAGQSLDGYAIKAGTVPDSFSFGTGVTGVTGQPATDGVAFFLASAAPNPMSSGQTAIAFGLPQAGQVRIDVYNIAGQRVKTLVNGNMGAGYHQIAWNGRNEAGQRVANGVYMYRMNSGSFTATKKLLMIK